MSLTVNPMSRSLFACHECDEIAYTVFAKRGDGEKILCSKSCFDSQRQRKEAKGKFHMWYLYFPAIIQNTAQVNQPGRWDAKK
mgnify:CR=1 FL=1